MGAELFSFDGKLAILHFKIKDMAHNKRYGSMDLLLELLLVLLLLLLLYVFIMLLSGAACPSIGT